MTFIKEQDEMGILHKFKHIAIIIHLGWIYLNMVTFLGEWSVNVDLVDDDGIITESGTDSLQEQADVHTFARMRYSKGKGALERTVTSLFKRAYYYILAYTFPIMIIYF